MTALLRYNTFQQEQGLAILVGSKHALRDDPDTADRTSAVSN